MELSEFQSPFLTSGILSNLELLDMNMTSMEMVEMELKKANLKSIKRGNTKEFSLKRYCNGTMGVPITFLDKSNPIQFEIIGLAPERLSEKEASLQIKRYKNAI